MLNKKFKKSEMKHVVLNHVLINIAVKTLTDLILLIESKSDHDCEVKTDQINLLIKL